jgi:MarR family transcriptional regulator, organic hydroperoxide resistance regulator
VNDPLTQDWQPEQVAVMEALRDWAVGFTELNHHLARWTGLPTSDANALGQVVWAAESGSPVSPAQLARRLGMTTGATTLLLDRLDRLERAGLVERSKESADRRRVTLRPTADGRASARAFLAFAGTEVADTLDRASAAELATVAAFLDRMTSAVDAATVRLRHHDRS